MSFSRILLVVFSILTLAVIYVFQQFNFLFFLNGLVGEPISFSGNIVFIFNKTLRLILNDLTCLVLIHSLFQDKKYLNVAFIVFLLEMLVLLPIYFIMKLTFEGNTELSSPLLSQIHRLIVNPMLMILLIISFFYQRQKANNVV
jgi:exosortase F-associated protein